jgi:hypothetical protein
MSWLSAEDNRGWRGPFLAGLELVRTRGASNRCWHDWDEAVTEVERIVTLHGWVAVLAPGFKEVNLGLRPVFLPSHRVDRTRTRARLYEKRTLEAQLGYARLDVPIEMPLGWTQLPGPLFRLRAITAILDGLVHLGESAGLGPPPLRTKPTKGSVTTESGDYQRIGLGRWLDTQLEAASPGQAVIVAVQTTNDRRHATRQRFLTRLGSSQELAVPELRERFTAWRTDMLIDRPAGDKQTE